MKLKLTPEDRKAIDLILDQAALTPGATPTQGFAAGANVEQVHSVRRVLGLLQMMPVSEPSPDLVRRTLARISEATGQMIAPTVSQVTLDGQQIRPA